MWEELYKMANREIEEIDCDDMECIYLALRWGPMMSSYEHDIENFVP
jgi:hypothetical protein